MLTVTDSITYETMFPEGIDLVIYINLDKRPDRRAELEAELSRLKIPEHKILRWPGVPVDGIGPRGGIVGTTISHTSALTYIESLPENIQTVLMLEDDFNFIEDAELVKTSLNKWLTYPRDSWDVMMLSYWVLKHEPYDDLASRTLAAYGMAGYLVNRQGLSRLLPIMREARDGLIRTGEEQYVNDVYWHRFMTGRKCFYFNKSLGYQRKSFSDVRWTSDEFRSRVD